MNDSTRNLFQEYLELMQLYGLSIDESVPATMDEMNEYYGRAETEFQNLESLPTNLKRRLDQNSEVLPQLPKTQGEGWASVVKGHQEWLDKALMREGWKIETPEVRLP